jgi:hypothetical protein
VHHGGFELLLSNSSRANPLRCLNRFVPWAGVFGRVAIGNREARYVAGASRVRCAFAQHFRQAFEDLGAGIAQGLIGGAQQRLGSVLSMFAKAAHRSDHPRIGRTLQLILKLARGFTAHAVEIRKPLLLVGVALQTVAVHS